MSDPLGAVGPSPSPAATTQTTTVEGDGLQQIRAAGLSLSESQNQDAQKAAESPFCRICLDGASAGTLRQVCGCQGTIGRLHNHCLMRWLGLSKKDHCELCLEPLPVKVQQPGLIKYALSGPRRNHCLIALDLFSLLLTIPLIIYCNLLYFSALQHFRELQYLKLRQYSFWEICFGVVITPFVLSGFVLWICYMYKEHYSNYKRWRSDKRQVTLCDPGPEEQQQQLAEPADAANANAVEHQHQEQPQPIEQQQQEKSNDNAL